MVRRSGGSLGAAALFSACALVHIRGMRKPIAFLPALVVLAGCTEPTAPPPTSVPQADSHLGELHLALDTVATGLTRPLLVASPPGDRRTLFIVEQRGRIMILRDGVLRAEPFLDISTQVAGGGEQGLLGLAFHPDYALNRRFFVNYTDLAGDTRIVEYLAERPVTHAIPSSARELIFVDQPAVNHNGGMLAFGPDGYLYIALGDGGGTNSANGQRTNTMLGKILRIDVDGAHPYAVPADNPFVGRADTLSEIWHLGLRNPWRFSFDRANGRMFIADVGAAVYEEVNVVAPGRGGVNFGWNTMEGPSCWRFATCDRRGLQRPVYWYTHDPACSITGGYVYRGAAMRELRGAYFFTDFCTGVVSSFVYRAGQVSELRDWSADIGTVAFPTSFGEDARGELYITTRGGDVYKLVRRP